MALILVIDVPQVLDTSKAGREATKQLEGLWKEGEKKPEAEQQKHLEVVQQQRDSLRNALLARMAPIVESIAKDKKADAVIEKVAVIWTSGEDITAEVISRLDS